MKVSIVIPAYNEADRLPQSLPKILTYLKSQDYAWEVIVVNDGSTGGTAAYARTLGTDVRLIGYDINRGKGMAVRMGMLAAQGEWRYLCDADLSTPIEELGNFFAHTSDADIIIGSRRVRGAQVEKSQAAWKVRLGQLGNMLIQTLLLPGIQDTRCGFKMFSQRTNVVFERQRLERWGYDDEVLFIARRHHFRIFEMPVRWVNDERTRVKAKDYLSSLWEVALIHFNNLRGLYK